MFACVAPTVPQWPLFFILFYFFIIDYSLCFGNVLLNFKNLKMSLVWKKKQLFKKQEVRRHHGCIDLHGVYTPFHIFIQISLRKKKTCRISKLIWTRCCVRDQRMPHHLVEMKIINPRRAKMKDNPRILVCMLLMRQRMVSWGISTQIWSKTSPPD